MFAGLTDLVDQLDKIIVNNRPLLDELFANLRELTNMIGQHDDLLRNLLQGSADEFHK